MAEAPLTLETFANRDEGLVCCCSMIESVIQNLTEILLATPGVDEKMGLDEKMGHHPSENLELQSAQYRYYTTVLLA